MVQTSTSSPVGTPHSPAASSPARTVVAVGASLCLCLTVVRAHLVGWSPAALLAPRQIPVMLMAAVSDIAYAAGMTAAFLLLILAARRWPRTQRGLAAVYVIAAALSLAAGVANVTVVRMLGRPLNYQWLYYSGFLQSLDAKQALMAGLTWQSVVTLVAACAVMLILAAGMLWLARRLPRPRLVTGRALAAGVVLALCAYFPLAAWYLDSRRWPDAKTANPITSLAASYVTADRDAELFTMPTDIGPDDVLTAAERRAAGGGAGGAPGSSSGPDGAAADVRNVIVFVLESVPAEYIETYGGRFPVTPTLRRYQDRSATFQNVYAHSPSTNNSLVSMLCSIYPWISYQALTEERPAIDVPSLSGELHRRGYATAFFYSADLSFQSADRFLSHRGFGLLEDYKTRDCGSRTFQSEEWQVLNGSDDACTTESLTAWIDAGRGGEEGGGTERGEGDEDAGAGKPFFAMLWTGQTHYPYFFDAARHAMTDFGTGDESLERYLNALKHGDRALGGLLEKLDAWGLSDSTLVIVVGDHGEAFGRHEQRGHASRIYEENLHVPLVLINPRLFHGERHDTVGGLVDLAPTVMELLGLETPGPWQGRSLFAGEADRSGRVYFFAPWSDHLFGYREGTGAAARKFILNGTRNTRELYDLSADPLEARDLADAEPDAVSLGQRRLAAWVQYQQRLVNGLADLPENGTR